MIHVERRQDTTNVGPYIREWCAFWTVVTCRGRYVMQPGQKDRHGRELPWASILMVQCDDCYQYHESESLRIVSWSYPDFG